MKHTLSRIFWCCGLAAAFAVLLGCYFNNTALYPSAVGFYIAEDTPFTAAEGITALASNGSTIVAVSYEGTIACSPDSGQHWQQVSPADIDGLDGIIQFRAVTWGGGYFLAVGDVGRAVYSRDGLHWQAGVIGPMSPKDILCVAAGTVQGQTVFTAAGVDGRLAHAVGSPTGPWYMADQSPFGSVQDYGEAVCSLAWGKIKGNGLFVAVGEGGKIAVMKDLSGKWYGARAGTGETFRGVAFGNDRFIVVGDHGMIKYSVDPLSYTWNTVMDSAFGLRPLTGIAFDPLIKHFVLYCNEGSGNVFIPYIGFSEYGDNWNAANFQGKFVSGEGIGALACTNSRIVLGGSRGTIAYSN